jgi:two-component system, NtrC family, response regulator AtoC
MSSPKTDGHKNGAATVPLPPDEIVFGCSSAMELVRKRAEKICQANIPVLLYGDAGTGKEILARWIHNHSAYRAGQFIKVNCAAIPGTLLESELFGYEQGAFTGAQSSKPGRVELAHNGTLFLDEIANLDFTLQSKLLHFLQDGRFSRIGDEQERTVETRIICSSNKDLGRQIDAGGFRADLFYRISVIQIRMPCLSERKEDIPLLAQYLRAAYEREFAIRSQPLDREMLNCLQAANWRGNIRELSNDIARHVLFGSDAVLKPEPSQNRFTVLDNMAVEVRPVPLKGIAKEAIHKMESKIILEALQINQWNRRKTAEFLKISYRSLISKIRNADLLQRAGRSAPVCKDASASLNSKSTYADD